MLALRALLVRLVLSSLPLLAVALLPLPAKLLLTYAVLALLCRLCCHAAVVRALLRLVGVSRTMRCVYQAAWS